MFSEDILIHAKKNISAASQNSGQEGYFIHAVDHLTLQDEQFSFNLFRFVSFPFTDDNFTWVFSLSNSMIT